MEPLRSPRSRKTTTTPSSMVLSARSSLSLSTPAVMLKRLALRDVVATTMIAARAERDVSTRTSCFEPYLFEFQIIRDRISFSP